MNSLERILRATRLEPVDRTPLVPQLFGHAAVDAGLSLRDYLHDGEALAHAQLLARERYRTDAVFGCASPSWSSAEKPELLMRALRDSHALATARVDGRLGQTRSRDYRTRGPVRCCDCPGHDRFAAPQRPACCYNAGRGGSPRIAAR